MTQSLNWCPYTLFPLSITAVKKEVRFEGDFQDTLPRSKSYCGRSGNRKKRNSRRKYSSENKLHDGRKDKTGASPSTSKSSHRHNNSNSNGNMHHSSSQRHEDDSDASSVCSTCSSSSDSTDDHAYELPQRRTYGGVRVSYVPNDALACARKRKQANESVDKDNKNCIISWGKLQKDLQSSIIKLSVYRVLEMYSKK